MRDENPKTGLAEFLAMVCFVGSVAAIGYLGYRISLDFLHDSLSGAREYGRLALRVAGPFLAGLIALIVYFRLRK